MTTYSHSEYLGMIIAFGTYGDFKKAADSYNNSHYPKTSAQTIKHLLEHCKVHGQLQLPPKNEKDQSNDSERQGESVTRAPTSNSGEASTSSQNMPPPNQ